MKGVITPGDKFNKVFKMMDASSYNIDIDMEDNTVLSAEMHVLTEMVKALIMSNEKFKSDDALVMRARTLTKKILGGEKNNKKDLE